jgi:hypothetical protein
MDRRDFVKKAPLMAGVPFLCSINDGEINPIGPATDEQIKNLQENKPWKVFSITGSKMLDSHYIESFLNFIEENGHTVVGMHPVEEEKDFGTPLGFQTFKALQIYARKF